MTNCPKCKQPEFRVVGQIPCQPNSEGRYMLRYISRRWVIKPMQAYVEFKCPCGCKWKEEAK